MKTLMVLASLFACAGLAARADDGQISDRTLARLGLSGMKMLSDEHGMAIRGQFAIAFSSASAAGGSTFTIINHPVGRHFAISAKVAISGGAFAGGIASSSSH